MASRPGTGLFADEVDVATDQTDILELAIGQLFQGLAGRAFVVPRSERGKNTGETTTKQAAAGERAGDFNNSHLSRPF